MGACREKASALIDLMFEDNGPGIAVASFKGGLILEEYFRGTADFKNHRRIDSSTAFHVASVSKQFTAYATAQLISEGRLNLEDKIGRYLSFLPEHASQITIAELLYHTSGLSDQWVLLNLAGWTDQDLVRTDDINALVRRQGQLKSLPGTRFSYTNTGYTLLAELIEFVVGQSLDEYLQKVLFRPLKMSHTRFRSDIGTTFPYEAECYSKDSDGSYRMTTPLFATVGATSLRSSLLDIALWAEHLMEGNDPGSRLMHNMGILRTGERISYGFGLYHGMIGGLRTLSHSGWDGDFSAHVLYVPENGVGAAVLSNGTHMNLELIASAFLEDTFEAGYVESQISSRLSALLKGWPSNSEETETRVQRQAYGSLLSGDVRIWEKDNKGQRLRYGSVQRAEQLNQGLYMLGASLSTLSVTEESLVISSPTQSLRQKLPVIPMITTKATFKGKRSFFSASLSVTYTLLEEEGKVLWIRPGRKPSILEEIGVEVFFAEGFTLQVSHEALTITNARSAPIRFERV